MHRRRLRANIVGSIIAVLAMVFCVRFAREHAAALPSIAWDRAALTAVAAAIGLHLLAFVALAVGARRWLRVLGHEVDARSNLGVFLGAQLAKYLPGNIMQYAARVELLRPHGVARRESSRAILLESAAIVVSGLGIAVAVAYGPGRALLEPLLDEVSSRRVARGFALLAIAGLGGVLVARRGWGRGARRLGTRIVVRTMVVTAPVYVLFFALQTAGLALVLRHVFDAEALPPLVLMGLFSVAWTAGFATPGAPAGLGIRELILLTGIEILAGPGLALGATAVHRLIGVAGDVVAFAIAVPLRRNDETKSVD